MSVLFDELRSRLHGERTRAGFDEVCRCLDAWDIDDPELIELALPYADDALAAWPDASREAPARGTDGVASGDPPIWLELAAGASYARRLSSPVAALDAHRGGALRRLHLGNVGIWSGLAAEVFSHPVMRNLEHLDLSGASFPLRVLAEHGALGRLTSLDLSAFGGNLDGFYEATSAYGQFASLRELRLPRLWPGAVPLTHLTSCAFWTNLESLDASWRSRLTGRRPREEVEAALDALPPSLRRADLTLASGAAHAPAALDARCPELESLTLSLTSARFDGALPTRALRALELRLCLLDADAVASLAAAPALESLTLYGGSDKILVRLTSGLPALRELRVLSHFDQPTLGEHLGVFGRSPSAPGLERIVLIMDEVGDEVLPRMRSWRKPALEELVLCRFSLRDADALADLLESDALPGLRDVVLAFEQGYFMPNESPGRISEGDRWRRASEDHAGAARVARAASMRGVTLRSDLSERHDGA